MTDRMADGYELVIGLETHVQLLTASKMFCGCSTDYSGAEPNTHTCPVCLGLPGTLPSPNRNAVELTVRTGLALGCHVASETHFDRKNYHYPDLPKGYQISQYDAPLATDGVLPIELADGTTREVGIERVHLEEDTGKLNHIGDATLVDFNRAGVPLVEIVTRPDMRSPEEARAYLEALQGTLRWIEVTTGQMAEGALRADVNVSVRPRGEPALGTKVEIKNLNSFASAAEALAHEGRRLIARLEAGQPIAQETRGWDEVEHRSYPQRTKEGASDYRYFPEPDLPPLVLEAGLVDEVRAALPELPWQRRARFAETHGLDAEARRLLTRDKATADYFEAAADAYDGAPSEVAQWITGPLFGHMNAAVLSLEATAERVPPAELAALLALIDDGTLHTSAAKGVLDRMVEDGEPAAAIVEREGLGVIDDSAALQGVVREVIAENPDAVDDYCGGKQAAIGFLVGGVMRGTRGQADPNLARQLLQTALESVCAERDEATSADGNGDGADG